MLKGLIQNPSLRVATIEKMEKNRMASLSIDSSINAVIANHALDTLKITEDVEGVMKQSPNEALSQRR